VEITALLAEEIDLPAGEEPITWMLLTSVPITTAEQAREVMQWYLCRWQEVFFRILKSDCQVEELQLEHIDRLP
jgi:dsDNA-binding SOS-regulon protein